MDQFEMHDLLDQFTNLVSEAAIENDRAACVVLTAEAVKMVEKFLADKAEGFLAAHEGYEEGGE